MKNSQLAKLVKASSFTRTLNPDPLVPTIAKAENAPDSLVRTARRSEGAFTWVSPQPRDEYIMRWKSPAAMDDLGLNSIESSEFNDVFSGKELVEDEETGIYPWAQNYAGYQFGQWAGQLGDGRVITLFNISGQDVQLKGAGLTPYSRFADGKAVLRSSIREALVSENLNALKIPTTRALCLTELPKTFAQRERSEKCAVVARFAPSWIRIGTFNLHHARGDRAELRKLADYCISDLGLGAETKSEKHNRYTALFKDVVERNAKTVAHCQAYGFLNGVLNTDNVSILGLSLDYGPFAFMDNFSYDFTPNHDDDFIRYGFKNVPSIMWWNLVRLGEALGELMGAPDVDSSVFIEEGIPVDERKQVIVRLNELIGETKQEFEETYKKHYYDLMYKRLGLNPEKSSPEIVESTLKMLEETEIDYNQFLRRLSSYTPGQSDKQDFATKSIPKEREFAPNLSVKAAKSAIVNWLNKVYDPATVDFPDAQRKSALNSVNPSFMLKNWILNDAIQGAQNGDWTKFNSVAEMALDPFAESWSNVPSEISDAYLGEVPRSERGSTCSCSS